MTLGLALGLLAFQVPTAFGLEKQDEAVAAASRHLRSAERLGELGLTAFAVEHLLEIDIDSLEGPDLETYAYLVSRVVEKLPFVDRSLRALAQRNTSREPLRHLADTWNAWAGVLIKDKRASAAIEAWDQALRLEPRRDRRVRMFGAAIEQIRLLDTGFIRHDPGVQNGALRAFVDAWGKNTDLGTEPLVARVVLSLESWVDPESAEATFWADRYVTVAKASPEALYRRGDLELRRLRPDLALPWLLWAAYTDQLTSEVSPRAWRALARVYSDFGWCEHAIEAVNLASSQEPPQCPERPEPRGAQAECLYWHDQLLGYSPERLTIRWAGSWQSSFPDLAIWRSRCDWARPDPFAVTVGRGECGRNAMMLPRLVAARAHPRRDTQRLLCALDHTTVPSSALTDHFRGCPDPNVPDAAYWEAWGRFTLRQGELETALSYVKRALEIRPTRDLLQKLQTSLAYSAAARESDAAVEILDAMREAGGGFWPPHSLNVAVVWRQIDPASPAALHWSEQALIDRRLGERTLPFAWLNRARVEWGRGGAGAALPYLLWADQAFEQEDGDTVFRRGRRLTADLLILAYSRLRWWDLARGRAAKDTPDVPVLSGLEPGDILDPTVPGRCRSLHSELVRASADGAIRAAGGLWRERILALQAWRTECVSPASGRPGDRPQ